MNNIHFLTLCSFTDNCLEACYLLLNSSLNLNLAQLREFKKKVKFRELKTKGKQNVNICQPKSAYVKKYIILCTLSLSFCI